MPGGLIKEKILVVSISFRVHLVWATVLLLVNIRPHGRPKLIFHLNSSNANLPIKIAMLFEKSYTILIKIAHAKQLFLFQEFPFSIFLFLNFVCWIQINHLTWRVMQSDKNWSNQNTNSLRIKPHQEGMWLYSVVWCWVLPPWLRHSTQDVWTQESDCDPTKRRHGKPVKVMHCAI